MNKMSDSGSWRIDEEGFVSTLQPYFLKEVDVQDLELLKLELIRVEVDGSAKTFVYKDPSEKLGLSKKVKQWIQSFRDRREK